MKVLIFRETGEPKSVLKMAEIPTPPLAPGEALVRVLLSHRSLEMPPETISPLYRGVRCFYCGKPVHLPMNMVGRAESIRNHESHSSQHFLSRVFLLRCRSCVREAVYTIDQVNDYPEMPTSQQSDLG